jgi:hypothetical protein
MPELLLAVVTESLKGSLSVLAIVTKSLRGSLTLLAIVTESMRGSLTLAGWVANVAWCGTECRYEGLCPHYGPLGDPKLIGSRVLFNLLVSQDPELWGLVPKTLIFPSSHL